MFFLPLFHRLHLSISLSLFLSRAFWTVSRLLSAELVLVAFFAAVPLWKRVSVCTWYKKTFLGVFFFWLAVHLVATYGSKPISQPPKIRIFTEVYTNICIRFSRKNLPFYLKHVLKLRPWMTKVVLKITTCKCAFLLVLVVKVQTFECQTWVEPVF